MSMHRPVTSGRTALAGTAQSDPCGTGEGAQGARNEGADAREKAAADTLALLEENPPTQWFWARARVSAAGRSLPRGFFHHTSVNHEFAAAIRGRFLVATTDGTFEMQPGSLLLIRPGVTHCELASDPKLPYQSFWCHLEHSLCEMGHVVYTPPSTYQMMPRIELIGRTDLESIAVAIAEELVGQGTGWRGSAYGLWVYLTNILRRRIEQGSLIRVRSSRSRTIPADAASWEIIGSALAFCAANFRKPIGLKDVARAVGYSPSHVGRLVRLHLGVPVSVHLLELKLAAAREFLLESRLSIAKIAESLGYTDPSHFSRAFTRALGLSPQAYRKQVRGL
jgi:AraC-like DNA-binding protein/mannose-6-phosphate isomerase-like protein (cupin superfamily)